MKKSIYIEPAWKRPMSIQTLVLFPPEGYEFSAHTAFGEGFFKRASKWGFSYDLQGFIGDVFPLTLLKSRFVDKHHGPPKGTCLTYSICHVVFRDEPWILDMSTELPYILAWNEGHLEKSKNKIRNVLASKNCKKIIFHCRKGMEAFLATFGDEFASKVEIIRNSVPARSFIKEYRRDKVKILFVNSANINTATHFLAKGGLETVEAFLRLSEKYENIQLVLRSSLPENFKNIYSKFKGIKIIDKPIPWHQLEKEWESADIFVLPNHINTPSSVFFDAMSYELPIVTTDTWANSEFITNNSTGFLIHNPRSARYEEGPIMHLSKELKRELLGGLEPQVVQGLVEKISILVDDPYLRKRMGRSARQEVDHGRFSLENRNKKLKSILDEATAIAR